MRTSAEAMPPEMRLQASPSVEAGADGPPLEGAATYLAELRTNWRFLSAAAFGQAAGYSLVNYINNVFTPHLIQDLGWSRADFALIGVTAFLGIVTQPIAGRLTDAFGVRRMAMTGVICAPLIFLAFSAMTGSITEFFLISLMQVIVVGGTTSAVVYSRLIAQQFQRARGAALALAACAPPAAAVVCIPFLSAVIDRSGWRAGYVAVAVSTAIVGLSVLFLIPKQTEQVRPRIASAGLANSYREILHDRAFQVIIVGMVLCNLSFTMQTSQLKVILLDRGVDTAVGSMAISLFAFSVIVGRLLCGLALDRFPAYLVAAICLGLPGVGLAALASGISAMPVITVAVALLGLSLGAESDILAYLVMKYFRLDIYSTVLGLVLGALALAISAGALLLSFTLAQSGSYTSFLTLSSAAALVGGAVFLRLRRAPAAG